MAIITRDNALHALVFSLSLEGVYWQTGRQYTKRLLESIEVTS